MISAERIVEPLIIGKLDLRDDHRISSSKMKQLELNEPASQTTSTTLLVSTKGTNEINFEECLEYDPYKHRTVPNATSDLETLVHLLKASLGTGILAMPMAFKHAGLFFGLVATFFIGYICTYCIEIWVKCGHILCQRKQLPSIGFCSIAEYAFLEGPVYLRRYARAARFIIQTALLVEMLGCCCAYNVFVAKTMKQVFEFYYDWNYDLRIFMVFLIPFLIPLNLIRSLKYLTPFSMISNILFVVGVLISYYYIFEDLPPISERPMFASVSQLPIFFGTTIFALEGVGVVMPLENNMKTPNHFIGCPGVLNIGMTILVTLYAITGFFGYLKYGDITEASVTLNLPIDKLLGQILKIMVAVGIFLTYSLLFYASMDVIWTPYKQKFERPILTENVLRIFLVFMTVVVAALFPNLGPFLSLIGALSLSTVGLIFPALMETLVYWESPGLGRYNWRLYKNILIGLFGIVGLITGTMMSVREFLEKE